MRRIQGKRNMRGKCDSRVRRAFLFLLAAASLARLGAQDALAQDERTRLVCSGKLNTKTDGRPKDSYDVNGATFLLDMKKKEVAHSGFIGACMTLEPI